MYKTIILTLLIIFPSSAFSDIDNIVGFNFGGILKSSKKLKKIKNNKKLSNISCVYLDNSVKFFDFLHVGTDKKGLINYLEFQKTYALTMSNIIVDKKKIVDDYKRVLSTIQKRYGKFDTSNAEHILGLLGKTNSFYMQKIDEISYNKSPKSTNIGAIFLNLKSNDNKNYTELMFGGEKKVNLILKYMDKSLLSNIESIKKEELSGF